jgi:hypothetical protein
MLKRHERPSLGLLGEPELRVLFKLRQSPVAVVDLQSHGESKLLSGLTGVSLPSAMGETWRPAP